MEQLKIFIKFSIYFIAKYSGLFHICRVLTIKKARILCYHGLEIKDECAYVPGLFIKENILRKRLETIKNNNFSVITLQHLYDYYKKGTIPKDTIVITFDDGFYSTFKIALPLLKEFDFESTLYLTSYYFNSRSPIYTLTLRYLFWKAPQSPEHYFDDITKNFPEYVIDPDNIVESLCEIGQKSICNNIRDEILSKTASILNIDIDEILGRRLFGLINEKEAVDCINNGMNIELHTHRHNFPEDPCEARYEIEKNITKVEPAIQRKMEHFCYPSGVWDKSHWQTLSALGIKTATTCESGLIDDKTPYFSWNRILDSSRVSQIEFEAEIMGFNECIRSLKKAMSK